MTKFTKDSLIKSGEYLMYQPEGAKDWSDRKFVARFKYQRGAMGTFKTFLIKNYTVEEYFGLQAQGKTPLDIVETKGYILPHIRKWAAEGCKEGIEYIARVAARNAARIAA